MPYVPSKKTDEKSTDREVLDAALETLAHKVADQITDNLSVLKVYRRVFITVARALHNLLLGKKIGNGPEAGLAEAIYKTGAVYDYEGAYLGEFNYAFTRFIQRVPGIMVEKGQWSQELRYWLYARTVSALIYASRHTEDLDTGVDGVFEDIKDEYKRRVNTAYEAEQILKSGDCYDTPYYTKLVAVVDKNGKLIGYQEIMLKRDASTLDKDVLDGHFILEPPVS